MKKGGGIMINAFGNMLKYLRERDGYTQEELSLKLNISRSTLANYEQGRRTPNHELEEIIADFFNVDLNTLRGIPTPDLDEDTLFIVKTYKKLSEANKSALKSYINYLLTVNSLNPEKAQELLNGLKGVNNGDKI